jgi:hypothetical protein
MENIGALIYAHTDSKLGRVFLNVSVELKVARQPHEAPNLIIIICFLIFAFAQDVRFDVKGLSADCTPLPRSLSGPCYYPFVSARLTWSSAIQWLNLIAHNTCKHIPIPKKALGERLVHANDLVVIHPDQRHIWIYFYVDDIPGTA